MQRRNFVACAICAAIGGLAATQVQAQAPTVQRTTLGTTDLDAKTQAILMMVEVPGGGIVARHTHPGIESTYVIEGTATLMVQGQADRALKAGEGFQVPPVTPHELHNGPATLKIAVTYVVEKGKPLASPA